MSASKNSSSKADEAAKGEAKAAEEAEPLVKNGGSGGNAAATAAGSANAPSSAMLAAASQSDSVIINVGGQRHEVMRKNFDRFPQSRLWKAMRANTTEEILRHCDKYRVVESGPPEYFFDRNYTRWVHGQMPKEARC